MRVIVVTSNVLAPWKREVIGGLGARLAGLAQVPARPAQGRWRHLSALLTYAWPDGVLSLALQALVLRLLPLVESVAHPQQPWTPASLARRMGVPYLAVRGVDDPRLRDWLATRRPDLALSMQSSRVGPELLGLAHLGWLNLHHGRLPAYRGVFSVFWQMVNREPAVCITAHLMGPQLDQGPVVAEELIAIPTGATVAQVEALAWSRSSAVMLHAVDCLAEDPPRFLRTPDGGGRYYSYPARSDLVAARQAGIRLR